MLLIMDCITGIQLIVYVNNETGAISEERLGHIVKNRRNEIFLSTKIAARDPEEAKQEIEEALKDCRQTILTC